MFVFCKYMSSQPTIISSRSALSTIAYKNWTLLLKIYSVNVTKIFSFVRIWSHLMKKTLMENFLFCAE